MRGIDRWPLTERGISAFQNRQKKRVRELMCSAVTCGLPLWFGFIDLHDGGV